MNESTRTSQCMLISALQQSQRIFGRPSSSPWTSRRAKEGRAPEPLPIWLGNILARVLLAVGPKGLEFGRYSVDYHFIRNWLYVKRRWLPQRAETHIPEYAKRLVAMYDKGGEISNRCAGVSASPFQSRLQRQIR